MNTNILASKEFEGMVYFIAFVYLARLVMDVYEGKGLDEGNLMIIGIGFIAAMFIRSKMLLIITAIVMVFFIKMSLVVREGVKGRGRGRGRGRKGSDDDKKPWAGCDGHNSATHVCRPKTPLEISCKEPAFANSVRFGPLCGAIWASTCIRSKYGSKSPKWPEQCTNEISGYKVVDDVIKTVLKATKKSKK